MPNHETSTYSSTSVCGGTAGERAARLLGSRSPPTPCVPFAEEFQPYTKSKKQYRTMGSHPLHSYLVRTGYRERKKAPDAGGGGPRGLEDFQLLFIVRCSLTIH